MLGGIRLLLRLLYSQLQTTSSADEFNLTNLTSALVRKIFMTVDSRHTKFQFLDLQNQSVTVDTHNIKKGPALTVDTRRSYSTVFLENSIWLEDSTKKVDGKKSNPPRITSQHIPDLLLRPTTNSDYATHHLVKKKLIFCVSSADGASALTTTFSYFISEPTIVSLIF